MDLGILILLSSISVGVLIVSYAFAHRLISETEIKKKAFDKSINNPSHEEKVDELTNRLERFQNLSFGRPMAPVSADPRSAIAQRIRAEEKIKSGG
jgi:hypothetical protein